MKLNRELTAAGLVFLFSFVVYLKTLAPSVFWWDSGELIANVSILGIAHRPGFPLYILLAKVFSLFSYGNLSWWVNLFSAVAASLSLSFTYLIFGRISRQIFPRPEQQRLINWTGLAFVLVLGFTYSFWIQAVRAEVYSLAFLLFSLLLWSAVKASEHSQTNLKYVLLFSFVLGLSLGNHHAIILSTVPALLYLIIITTRQSRNEILRLFPVTLALVLLGLSVYLYLPIRASFNPVLNWGNPTSLSAYFSNILASESVSQVNWFSSARLSSFSKIPQLFFNQLTLFPFILALIGFGVLYRRHRQWFWFGLGLTLCNWLVLSLLTDQFIPNNPDLHGYLLPSLFFWSAAFAWGSLYSLTVAVKFFSQPVFTSRLKETVTAILVAFILLLATIPFLRSRAEADLSANLIPSVYARQAVAELERNSLAIIDNPNLDFLLRGLQYGERFREDLILIDRTLLPARWYCRQIRHNYPHLFLGVSDQLIGEKLALTLAMNYLNQGKPVYWEFTEKDSALARYLLPVGYLGRIVKNPEQYQSAWEKQKSWEAKNLSWGSDPAFSQDGDAQRVWSRIMYLLGYFYQCKGKLKEAGEKYEKVLALSPDETLVSFRLRQLVESQPRADK